MLKPELLPKKKWILVRFTPVGRDGLAALDAASRSVRGSVLFPVYVAAQWSRWREGAIATDAEAEISTLSGRRSLVGRQRIR